MWSIAETREKLARAQRLPFGVARTRMNEWIVRILEKEGPREKLPQALLDLVEAYTWGVPSPYAFGAMSKVLRLYDENPEFFTASDRINLFWEYKWVASDVADYWQVSRSQAEAFFDDMGRRFALAGYNESAVLRARLLWHRHLGEKQEVERYMTALLATPSDDMDCESCRHSEHIDYFISRMDYERALALGLPSGFECNRQPCDSHRLRALAFLEIGDGEKARDSLARAQATHDDTAFNAPELGLEFEILARGGQGEEAFELLKSELHANLDFSFSPRGKLTFLIHLIAGISALEEEP